MCGIAGAVALERRPIPRLGSALNAMSDLIAHRGPDGKGFWQSPERRCGLAHRRLSIIDLTDTGAQPMTTSSGAVITFNGEIYNYRELMRELSHRMDFPVHVGHGNDSGFLCQVGDVDCLSHLRGMFAFALWDGSGFLRPAIVSASSRFIILSWTASCILRRR